MKKFQLFLLLIMLESLTSFNVATNQRCAAVTISIGNGGVVEGNSGQRSIEVMIILDQPATTAVSVTYNTKNGTASAGSDYVAANGTVSFNPGERKKKISILVNGDIVCEGSETFEIVLNNPSGASLAISAGTVTIVNDDCITPSAGIATYEIKLIFTGYTSFCGGPPDCPIRSNGRVILSGLVSGNEKVNSDDDIMYYGSDLWLDIDMDICTAKRVNGEDQLCGMTVIGGGFVNVELEVQFDARGGYIKMEDKSGNFFKMVFGSCDAAEMKEEETMVPNKTIASIFNGYELTPLTNRTLNVGRYVMNGDAGETVVEILRKIR